MERSLRGSAQRVQEALLAQGLAFEVVEFAVSTRTAQDAAQAIGCTVGQIAKSLVFRGAASNRPILVIASGANRVDEGVLAGLVGEPIARADAAFVREQTGFAIGGVAPLGHPAPLLTFLDADLWQHEVIWAAAGTPNAVFRLTPPDLERLTAGQIVRLSPAS